MPQTLRGTEVVPEVGPELVCRLLGEPLPNPLAPLLGSGGVHVERVAQISQMQDAAAAAPKAAALLKAATGYPHGWKRWYFFSFI